MPCGATQDGLVMVERSDRMWSTGEGNGKPLQYFCLENPMNSVKRQNDRILKEELPRSDMLLEISGEITPERKKGWSKSKNNTQLWMWLLIKAKSNAVKSNIAYEPGMLGPWIKANWKWSNRRWHVWHRHFRNQLTKTVWNGWMAWNLIWCPLYLLLWARIP